MFENYIRLKYMQAVALVTGDEFLSAYNLTIHLDSISDIMNNLGWKWYQRLVQNIGFDDFYGIAFAPILGHSGFCFTFNIIKPEEIFYLEM